MKSKQILRFYFMVIAFVFSFVFVGSLCAQQGGPKNEKGNFQSFDKNNDGQVSKEEFPGPDQAFERLDKNQDGYIDESEAPKGQKTGARRGGGDFIQNLDKNDDGQVSKEEFPGPDEGFDRMDKNQDGYIDASEAPKGQKTGARRGGGDFIQNLDKNDDGQVSKEEFPGPDEGFDRMDKNQDGYIDASEVPKGPPGGRKKGD